MTFACSGLCHDRRVSPASTAQAQGQRVRLDQLLVERGLVETRSRAQALVLAGKVRVGDGDAARARPQAGRPARPGRRRSTVAQPEPYVSRGGHKLAAALDAFEIDPAGRVALDVGASTGGFTDVLLQRGATRVYALDVGRGQLAETLRRDPRVVSMERTNARDADRRPACPSRSASRRSTCRSSRSRWSSARSPRRSAPGGHIVALVKPQFEAGQGRTDHGVVRDPAIHREVLERTVDAARGARASARARSSPRRSPGRRATASSWSTSRPGPAAPRSASGSPRSPAR